MSFKAFALFCCSIAAIGHLWASAEVPQSLSVTISCPQPQIKSGSSVKLLITLTNISDNDVEVEKIPGSDGHAEDLNRVEVRDLSGQLLPRIDYFSVNVNGKVRKLRKRIVTSTGGKILKPGEKLVDFTVLSDIFDLTKPGGYTVLVQNEREYGDSVSGVRFDYVKSNTITISVVP